MTPTKTQGAPSLRKNILFFALLAFLRRSSDMLGARKFLEVVLLGESYEN